MVILNKLNDLLQYLKKSDSEGLVNLMKGIKEENKQTQSNRSSAVKEQKENYFNTGINNPQFQIYMQKQSEKDTQSPFTPDINQNEENKHQEGMINIVDKYNNTNATVKENRPFKSMFSDKKNPQNNSPEYEDVTNLNTEELNKKVRDSQK